MARALINIWRDISREGTFQKIGEDRLTAEGHLDTYGHRKVGGDNGVVLQ